MRPDGSVSSGPVDHTAPEALLEARARAAELKIALK